jgi:hypothetical protein
MKGVIVVEGRLDAALIQRLLPDPLLDGIRIANAKGKSSAVALCRSLLMERQQPTVLLTDAETTQTAKIREDKAILEELIGSAARSAPYHVALAIPEVEVVFFSEIAGLEEALGVRPEAAERVKAEYRPGEVLRQLIQRSDTVDDELDLISRLSRASLDRMADHPLIREIAEFLHIHIHSFHDDPIPQTGT